MSLPILYSYRRCPYAMRARMALRYAGIQVEMREIALRDKPQHMLQASPKATVPVLLLSDGRVSSTKAWISCIGRWHNAIRSIGWRQICMQQLR